MAAGHKLFARHLTNDGSSSANHNANLKVGSLGNATYIETGSTLEDEWTLASHGLYVGDLVQFSAVGTGATGYAVTTDYYIAEVSGTDKFTLSATQGGSAIEGTGNSAGTWTIARQTTKMYFQPAADEKCFVARLIVTIQDANGARITDYGNITNGITNGITVWEEDDSGTIVDFTDGHPITINGEWGHFCYDVNLLTWGSGEELVVARWSFFKFGVSGGIFLDGANSERFGVTLDDDLSGLVGHHFLAQGHYTGIDG